MRIKEALLKYKKEIDGVSETPFLDVDILLSHVLKKDKVFIYTYPETKLNFFKLLKFRRLINKRKKNFPIAYLVGFKEFYNNKFIVNKNVLIPRPETEILVEKIIEEIKNKKGKINLLEIGTGSGNIVTSIVLGCKQKKFNKIIAVDVSKKALNIAYKNLKRFSLDKKVKLMESNLLEKISDSDFDVIVANLPYASEEDYKNLTYKEVYREPKLAIVGGELGSELFKELIERSISKLSRGGILALEIGKGQTETILKILKRIKDLKKIEILKDLARIERIIVVYKN